MTTTKSIEGLNKDLLNELWVTINRTDSSWVDSPHIRYAKQVAAKVRQQTIAECKAAGVGGTWPFPEGQRMEKEASGIGAALNESAHVWGQAQVGLGEAQKALAEHSAAYARIAELKKERMDYEDIAISLAKKLRDAEAALAAQGAELAGYVRRHPSGELSGEYLCADCIEEEVSERRRADDKARIAELEAQLCSADEFQQARERSLLTKIERLFLRVKDLEAEQVADAQRVVSGWSDEKRASVRLEGQRIGKDSAEGGV